MKTISLTTFNQNPSRAVRLAERDGKVQITRRGRVAYQLSSVGPATPADPIDALVAAGLASLPRTTERRPIRRGSPVPGVGVGDLLEADRNRRGLADG
ncbi:MAG: type II toxin-antitoxin system Phd/YefM family antitoxin [Bifidobacteriaceae bacterium]|nr:type II toxin-antitoxin system Phd/YefM family antitoxin [Bifidobacteriaceae bacterium]